LKILRINHFIIFFRLFVREDSEHHVNIVGLTEIVLKNLDTLRSIIYDGLARRHHGKSAFNSNSSRSHAIFQILLKNTSNQTDYFRLVFIDLAGSERATDAQNNQKQTRREGAQINSSLLALKECIRSMDMTHSHAPFRQSKLTHILRDSLVGSKTRTCLLANVSPADDCCQCSLNTLQYASRIRDISIRHRHRSMPMNNIQRNYIDNEPQVVREKSQRTFKPATASTPVQRRITAVEHRTYMTNNPAGICSESEVVFCTNSETRFRLRRSREKKIFRSRSWND
jgi:kinesin family protein 2/24